MEEFIYRKEKERFHEAAQAYASCIYERFLDRINDALRKVCSLLHVETGRELIHLLSIITALEALLIVYYVSEDYSALKESTLALIIIVAIYMGAWYKRDEWKK